MSRFFRLFAFVLLLLGLGAVLASVILRSRAQTDRTLEAGWRKTLGGASFLERYPPAENNAKALELEAAGAALGLEMAPADAPGRSHPTRDAARRFEAIKTLLRNHLDPSVERDDGAFPAPPPALAAFLDRSRPGLDRIATLLLADPLPVWEFDLGKAFEATLPNYLGVLGIERLLAAEALERIRTGHPDRALPLLEAAWRLDQAVRAGPTLIPQLISLTDLKYVQLGLRALPAAPPVWRERMTALDLRRGISIALRAEAFVAYLSSFRARPLGSEKSPTWTLPFVRWGLHDYARRFQPMIEEMEKRDLSTFDASAFGREMDERMPRWQIVARLMLPNFWDSWPKAARGELAADLTARILAERERLAAGDPPRPNRREPSRIRGLSWLYEDVPDGTRIRLDGDLLYKDKKGLPLRFTLRRPE